MEYQSAGRDQLVAFAEKEGLASLARRLSPHLASQVHHTTVRGWALGLRRPELPFAVAMSKAFQIPVEAWVEPAAPTVARKTRTRLIRALTTPESQARALAEADASLPSVDSIPEAV